MKILPVNTAKRCEFLDISSEIKKSIHQENIKKGICFIFCPHTTAALTINENADSAVKQDILDHLNTLVPANKNYSHLEGNSDSHIKASLLGSSLSIVIENSELVLGTWQGIYFCEFDGPRNRKVYISILPG